MLEWVKNIMNTLGYPGVAFLMFLENVFPPIPSEIVMPLAGFTSTQGNLNFIGIVIAGTLGSVLGAIPLFYLGKLVGEERLTAWADKHGKWLTVSGDEIRKADQWFERHGTKAVFFCRLIPGIRSLISIPAGISGMNFVQFLLYTTLGASIWTTALAFLGRVLGENYELVDRYLGPVTYIVVGVLLVVAIGWVWKRKHQHKAAHSGANR